jgi:hypothetical protein
MSLTVTRSISDDTRPFPTVVPPAARTRPRMHRGRVRRRTTRGPTLRAARRTVMIGDRHLPQHYRIRPGIQSGAIGRARPSPAARRACAPPECATSRASNASARATGAAYVVAMMSSRAIGDRWRTCSSLGTLATMVSASPPLLTRPEEVQSVEFLSAGGRLELLLGSARAAPPRRAPVTVVASRTTRDRDC